MRLPVAVLLSALAVAAPAKPDPKAEILKAEESFRQARLHNDVAALDRLLAPDFIQISQWGFQRDRKSLLEQFKTFPVHSATTLEIDIRIAKDTAVATGKMREDEVQTYLFMRTYIRRNGRWQLLSNYQGFAVDQQTLKAVDFGR